MPTEAGFDPQDFSGFTAAHLQVLERFRDVAIDNHLSNGNLDGTGNNPDIQHHIKGVVDGNTLLSQYELPVVMSMPTGIDDTPRNIQANTTTYGFSVSAWVSDYDQQYGLELAQIIVGNVVNNVEQNRSLKKSDGTDPIATDAHLAGSGSVTFDFALNVAGQKKHLKYGTAEFMVETKRQKP